MRTLPVNAQGDRTWLPLQDDDWLPFCDLDPTLPEPDYPELDIERTKRITREYLASVHSVDRNLGRILDTLDALGLADNTVVILSSDHGYNMGHHGIWHKGNGRWLLKTNRGSRPNLWDTSIRTPTVVRWPRRLQGGTVLNRTITNLDWFPTLLAMANLPIPETNTIHGRNFLPLLEGRHVPWDDDLFAEYSMRHGDFADLRCYRTPHWKLIRDFCATCPRCSLPPRH